MWTLGLGRNPGKSRPVAAVTVPATPGSGCDAETVATSQLGSSVVMRSTSYTHSAYSTRDPLTPLTHKTPLHVM